MKKILLKTVVIASLIANATFCFCQSNTESLIEHLTSYIEQKKIPGAMISIVYADTVIFSGGIGFANIEKQEKVTAQHLFRQGSISKSFTAMGLYTLLEKTPYTLDSPIKNIDERIPFTNQWENDNPVRVSHLLEHTSGFEDFHLHAMYNNADAVLPPILKMVNDHKQSLHSRWKPGSKKAYANPNYIIAGHLLEKLSGTAYHTYINETILTPIGMKSSGFYFKEPKNKLMTQGYQKEGTKQIPISFVSINGGPAGDFCTNAADMSTYMQFMLNRDSTLFSHADFDRLETPKTSMAAQKGLPAGYGLGNYTIWKNGYLFHGHGGGINGFASRYVYSREANLGVAVAINRNGDANAVVKEILNYLLKKTDTTQRVTHPIPESLKSTFSGFYEFNSPKSELIAFSDRMLAGLTLDFENDKLITRSILGKPKDTLYYAGNNQFYFNNEGVPSAMLIESNPGTQAFWINDHYTEKKSRTKRLIIFFGLLISFLLLASFLIYSTIWLIRRVLVKGNKSPVNHLVLFGVGISFVLLFLGFGMNMSDPKYAGNLNFYSLLMYVSSYAMLMLALISVYRCFKLPEHMGFKIYYILNAFAAVTLSFYLWDIGFMGLKLWSY